MKEIQPVKNLNAEITAPPSKAHTIRALFLAALSNGTTTIKNPLMGKDQKVAMQALKDLGVQITHENNTITIQGMGGKFSPKKDTIYIENSGITARILAVAGALSDKEIIINGDERMRSGRPIQGLLDAAEPLGIKAESVHGNGCPPIRIKNTKFKGGKTSLRGDKSSQYFSSLLIAAPFAEEDIIIETEGELMSKPYVDITISMMREFGVEVVNHDHQQYMGMVK